MTKLSELAPNTEVRLDDFSYTTRCVGELIDRIKEGNIVGWDIRVIKLADIPYTPDGQVGAEDIIQRIDDEHEDRADKNDTAVEELKSSMDEVVAKWRAKYEDTTKVYDTNEAIIENDIV